MIARYNKRKTGSFPAWWWAFVVGSLLRVCLYLISEGTNDVRAWAYFARLVQEHGLEEAYAREPLLNHPILMTWLGYIALVLSDLSGFAFHYIFKLPPLLADMGTMYLLAARGAQSRSTSTQGAWLYATSIPAILISSYHGNTDSLCVFLIILAVYLLEQRRRSIKAGIALALAINVKLIPLILVPALGATLINPRERVEFFATLSLGCIPLAIATVWIGQPFVSNVLAYRSLVEPWGVNFFLWSFESLVMAYHNIGGSLIICSIILVSLYQWRRQTYTAVEISALCIVLFLLLAPGFGIQYLIYPAPLLVQTIPRLAACFGVVAGAMAMACYGSFISSWWPISSKHHGSIPPLTAFLGALVWLLLALFLTRILKPKRCEDRRA